MLQFAGFYCKISRLKVSLFKLQTLRIAGSSSH